MIADNKKTTEKGRLLLQKKQLDIQREKQAMRSDEMKLRCKKWN